MSKALQCTIAQTEEDRNKVYRLRYQCYRRDASIEVNPRQSFRDEIDADPNHFSFLLTEPSDNPVATIRVSVVRRDLGWSDSPGMHVFGDHPELCSMARSSFVEASRLCFAQQARRDAFLQLLASMAAMADFYEVDWLVACPRVEHAPTYRNLFGFQTLAPARQYYGVNFKTELLACKRTALELLVSKSKLMIHLREHALQALHATHSQGALWGARPIVSPPLLQACA